MGGTGICTVQGLLHGLLIPKAFYHFEITDRSNGDGGPVPKQGFALLMILGLRIPSGNKGGCLVPNKFDYLYVQG